MNPVLMTTKRDRFSMLIDLLNVYAKEPCVKTRAMWKVAIPSSTGEILLNYALEAGLAEKIKHLRKNNRGGPATHDIGLTEKGRLFINHIESARKLLQFEE